MSRVSNRYRRSSRKAYVRPEKAPEIIEMLEQAGPRDMTVIDVDIIGAIADPAKQRRWVLKYAEKYSSVTKIETAAAKRR